MKRIFRQVDVFTSVPYMGNPVAVVLGRAGRIHVNQDAEGTIWVGGGTVTCIEGRVEL